MYMKRRCDSRAKLHVQIVRARENQLHILGEKFSHPTLREHKDASSKTPVRRHKTHTHIHTHICSYALTCVRTIHVGHVHALHRHT